MASDRQNMHALRSAIRFFKIITKPSLEDGKLRIPKGFTSEYGDNMPNPLFLKAPNGKEWSINWTKHDGDIWFQKGWEQFSTYYSLDHGHLVLFEYQETSDFVIHIFDTSTLEIKYNFDGCQDEHNNRDRISEDSDEILDEVTRSKKTRVKSPMSCPPPYKKLRTDKSEDGGSNSKLQKKSNLVRAKDDNDGSTKCVKVEQEDLTSNITEALCRDNNFISKNPSFPFVMKPSYLYNRFLHVPSKFAKKYLKIGQGDILLRDSDGRTWPSKYSFGRIRNGWNQFVLDNNLKVGDVCDFELTNSQDLTLKVTIFRLGEQSRSPPPQVSVKQEVTPLDPARTSYVEIKTSTIPNEDGKATQRTTPQTSEAGEEANKFTSENPFFVINIGPKKLGRIYRPCIPSDIRIKYLHEKQTVMLQFKKQLWQVNLGNGRPKARFCRGWYMFMTETKLQTGDVCVFELINKEDALFHVHIFRGQS